MAKFATTDSPRPSPIFSNSYRIESLPAYGQNWVQNPNGLAITHKFKVKVYGFAMYIFFCSMFSKARNRRFVSSYMLDRLIIQNALFVNSINNIRSFTNLLLSYRERYYQPDLNITCIRFFISFIGAKIMIFRPYSSHCVSKNLFLK